MNNNILFSPVCPIRGHFHPLKLKKNIHKTVRPQVDWRNPPPLERKVSARLWECPLGNYRWFHVLAAGSFTKMAVRLNRPHWGWAKDR